MKSEKVISELSKLGELEYSNYKTKNKQQSTIYILIQGDYHRSRNTCVTTNVKEVSKRYVDVIKSGGFGSSSDNPYIEIWVDSVLVTDFHENEDNERRLVKYLSKLSIGLK
ncbi:hypothetical protein [Metabacillus fastidiosus]|uniref:hypothetical protein n=1 Tax=Metabacillus fastidiosus TaxID=1458 RepID=UPI003D2DB685